MSKSKMWSIEEMKQPGSMASMIFAAVALLLFGAGLYAIFTGAF